jgi:outer membrane protein OmpA-like peptidoglycan-associated protein
MIARHQAALGLGMLVMAVTACDSQGGALEAVAAAPQTDSRLIVLPDSAIAVRPGSVEEQLALYLASPAPAPRLFRFAGAEFQPWETKPNPATLRTMYAVQQILRAYPRVRVTIIGHTDNDGTPERNLALSRARAERMALLLVRGGIAARRVKAEGRGLEQPVADNATLEGRARNRRIELLVTTK